MPVSRRLSPTVLAALFVGFLLLRAALFAITTGSEYALYLDYAKQARNTSLAELHQTRDIEYPALATLFGVAVLHVAEVLPEWTEGLTAWRPEETRGPLPSRFEVALGLVLFAVDAACLCLVYFVARRIHPDDSTAQRAGRLGMYVAGTTALGLILYDRQDLVVGFIGLAAIFAVARGWPLAAYATLAIGTGYKLVPLLLFPLCVIAVATMRVAPNTSVPFARAIVRQALIAGAMLALVPALMYAFCGGERAFVFLSFHSTRGLQLEAAAAWPVMLLDPATAVGHSFGSHTLRGHLADRVAKASSIATALVSVFVVLAAARGFWRGASRSRPDRSAIVAHFAVCSLLVWLAFILFTKVGSPQYLLWIAPLVPQLPLRGSDRKLAVLLIAGMVVTTLIYPCQYRHVRGELVDETPTWAGPTPFGYALLIAKSAILSVSFVWLAVLVWRAKWISTKEDQ